MARRQQHRALRTLEEGSIEILHRPRVEVEGVQRLLLVLIPADRSRYRLIVTGRKRTHARFWGFVDLVLDDARDLHAALGAHVYETTTGGIRHLPAPRRIGHGSYSLAEFDGHTHLRYSLDTIELDGLSRDLAVDREAAFIVSVANPDSTAWGLLEVPDIQFDLFDEAEVHVTVPTPFPPSLQTRFEGRRYTQLDTPAWLDHPGAELIFTERSGTRSRPSSRM